MLGSYGWNIEGENPQEFIQDEDEYPKMPMPYGGVGTTTIDKPPDLSVKGCCCSCCYRCCCPCCDDEPVHQNQDIIVLNEPPPFQQGYYWCDAAGGIPPGAIKAGVDKDGGELYVGRAHHNGEIQPAKVAPNHGCAFVAWGGEEHRKLEYEVLCRGPCTVIWQEAEDGVVPPGAVPVGVTSENERLYVGRVFHDGTHTPGKIHPSHGVCYIPYDGTEISFSSYEVLILQ